jgi:hypothetical protein
MTRPEAITLFLSRIKHLTCPEPERRWYFDSQIAPVLEKELKEFVAMIERELFPVA